jgi:hypothetical protein
MEHWSTPDPTWVPGGPQAVHRAFQEVRDRLEEQILDLMKRLDRAGRPAPKAPQDAPPLKKRMARS